MLVYRTDLLLEEYGQKAVELFNAKGISMPMVAAVEDGTAEMAVLTETMSPAMYVKFAMDMQVGNEVCRSFILVAPQLMAALDAGKAKARSVVAHELGHAYFGHLAEENPTCSVKKLECGSQLLDDIILEKEADNFAVRLGLGDELTLFLKMVISVLPEESKGRGDIEERIAALLS